KLVSPDRKLMLQYYQDERRAKIDHRIDLARQMGVSLNTLRMRTHRIRQKLQKCVIDCLKQSEG
ncbi:MAG TPA: hypothetical protein VLD57_00580, partial [Blastocatellia bacterium]|nr:hypothetical protein [Blastocatellia bacterium]